jgi:hypothetical protein
MPFRRFITLTREVASVWQLIRETSLPTEFCEQIEAMKRLFKTDVPIKCWAVVDSVSDAFEHETCRKPGNGPRVAQPWQPPVVIIGIQAGGNDRRPAF